MITLTVKSTHFYLIDCQGGKLLIDAGWEWAQFSSQMKAYKIPITAIKFVMFTHHHPDHAGLVQNVKEASGARMLIHQKQIPFLDNLKAFAEKKGGATPIRVDPSDWVSPSRAQLHSIGVEGEIIETPGHSDDSISLVLDSGAAFIGDLPLPGFSAPENLEAVVNSWQALLDHKAQAFYHSHTDPISKSTVIDHLRSL